MKQGNYSSQHLLKGDPYKSELVRIQAILQQSGLNLVNWRNKTKLGEFLQQNLHWVDQICPEPFRTYIVLHLQWKWDTDSKTAYHPVRTVRRNQSRRSEEFKTKSYFTRSKSYASQQILQIRPILHLNSENCNYWQRSSRKEGIEYS